MRITYNGLETLISALDIKTEQAERGLKDIVSKNTADMHRLSQENVPVITGHLKRSIRIDFQDGGYTGRVRATAIYARWVETGTRRFTGRFYIRKAYNVAKRNFVDDVERMIGK